MLPGEGGVRDRGDQQRRHVRGDLGEGWHHHGGGEEGGVETPSAVQDVREDLPVR